MPCDSRCSVGSYRKSRSGSVAESTVSSGRKRIRRGSQTDDRDLASVPEDMSTADTGGKPCGRSPCGKPCSGSTCGKQCRPCTRSTCGKRCAMPSSTDVCGSCIQRQSTADVCAAKRRKSAHSSSTDIPRPPKQLFVLQKAADAFRMMGQTRKQQVDRFRFEVDPLCPMKNNSLVYEDYSCNLCFCNIIHDLNNYYSIQVLIDTSDQYFVWVRWGRLGVSSKTDLIGPTDREEAIQEFKSKFMEKTQNSWCSRAKFVFVPCRYQLVEHADEVDIQIIQDVSNPDQACDDDDASVPMDCTSHRLISYLNTNGMFQVMKENMDIVAGHHPMGRLSRGQVSRALETLIDLRQALDRSKGWHELVDLSARFYSLAPHDFGDDTPPIINSPARLTQEANTLMAIYLRPL